MLQVFIDFKSPASYLAFKPTLDFARRLDLDISWHPFSTEERDIPDHPEARSHFEARKQALEETHRRYAALQGTDLHFPEPAPETDLALGALALINSNPLPFILGAYTAYWEHHANLNDVDTVSWLIAAHTDLSPTVATLTESFTTAQSKAEELGIIDAPTFVVENQFFVGRQHFPWIEELVISARKQSQK